MDKVISVIIPIYNVGAYIEACLQSLYAQTYQHLELILVNDCSVDDTKYRIQQFLSKHTSQFIDIKIVDHTENKGVAAARNTGLSHATGEYLYYVDADDRIETNAIETLLRTAIDTNADIVGCEWFLSYHKNERRMVQPTVNTAEEAFHHFVSGTLRWNLWLFLVKRELYTTHQISFIEGMNMGEDMMVMGKLILSANKVVVVHKPLYHYVQTNSASLTKESSERHRYQVTSNMRSLEEFAYMRGNNSVNEQIQYLKLSIKLPLLMSDNKENYITWLEWFPEANAYITKNKTQAFRTRLVQIWAVKRYFFLLKLYYRCVFKFIYGILYK